jgi:hypothetical protein
MECDYTCLNDNSFVTKKSGHQGHDYKDGLGEMKKSSLSKIL